MERGDCEISRRRAVPCRVLSTVRVEALPPEALARLEIGPHVQSTSKAPPKLDVGLREPNPNHTPRTHASAPKIVCPHESLSKRYMTRGGVRAPRGAHGGNNQMRRGPVGGQTATPSTPSKCP